LKIAISGKSIEEKKKKNKKGWLEKFAQLWESRSELQREEFQKS